MRAELERLEEAGGKPQSAPEEALQPKKPAPSKSSSEVAPLRKIPRTKTPVTPLKFPTAMTYFQKDDLVYTGDYRPKRAKWIKAIRGTVIYEVEGENET
ncbi:unnamed protein product [Trichobilharzia regenti]|nr:unnamed protein product [Trichobilharzia regenti]